jgi:hypothetical protein
VYWLDDPPDESYSVFDPPQTGPSPPLRAGLNAAAFDNGFETEPAAVEAVPELPELTNAVRLHSSRLQWDGWLRSDDAIYTFETTSDDGSWIYLNDKLLLDNGGTHPAKRTRRTVRLAHGWYAFKLRYEDTGGDHFLSVRIFKGHQPTVSRETLLFSTDQSTVQRRPSR